CEGGGEGKNGDVVVAAAVAPCDLRSQCIDTSCDVAERCLVGQHNIEGQQARPGVLAADDFGYRIETHDIASRASMARLQPDASARSRQACSLRRPPIETPVGCRMLGVEGIASVYFSCSPRSLRMRHSPELETPTAAAAPAHPAPAPPGGRSDPGPHRRAAPNAH